MMKKLIINEKCVYKIKVEKLDEFNDSFFADVYLKAARDMTDIINSSMKNYSGHEAEKNNNEDFNNIIAFSGERGTGKTSSMISFKNSLEKLSDIEKLADGDLKDAYCKLKQYNFLNLDTIDPSVFNCNDSIIEIVVAEMFKNFKIQDDNKDIIKKQKLVRYFETVYKDLRTLNKERNAIFNENSDNLEVLMDLSSAIDLKKDMERLVEAYLEYMIDKKDRFLVITIDDLDMNISAGEKMIEDIRKYLIIPKVIILMAVKFSQLEEVVKQKNVKDLSKLIDYYRNTDSLIRENRYEYNIRELDGELNNKTQKYLEKIIPYNKRIYMPSVHESDAHVIIELENLKGEYTNMYICIAENFYKYLGYIIITKKNYTSLVNDNLRAIVDLIFLFSKLKKVNNVIEKNEEIVDNLETIKEYLNKIIYDDRVNDFSMSNFLRDLLECPIGSINRKIMLYLNSYLYSGRDNKHDINKEILIYLDELYKMERNVVDRSVSLGDVVTWIKLYEDRAILDKEKIFIELLKTVYSIRLVRELYVESEELIYIIGRDVIGKYFEFANNIQANKIEIAIEDDVTLEKLNLDNLKFCNEKDYDLPEYIKTYVDEKNVDESNENKYYKYKNGIISSNEVMAWKDKTGCEELIKAIKSYYLLLEPLYVHRGVRILSKLYREQANIMEEKIRTDKFGGFNKFYFKPLNVLGISDDVFENVDKSFDEELISLEQNKSGCYLSINNYILFCNLDFYMKALNNISKMLENTRFGDITDIGNIIKRIYETTQRNFIELYSKYNYIDVNNPIECIINDKNLNLEFICNNVSFLGKNNDESAGYYEMTKVLAGLQDYITIKLSEYRSDEGITGTTFSRFESVIKKRIENIRKLNNENTKLNSVDINNLEKILLEVIDLKKQDTNPEKEINRILALGNNSFKIINDMLKQIKK